MNKNIHIIIYNGTFCCSCIDATRGGYYNNTIQGMRKTRLILIYYIVSLLLRKTTIITILQTHESFNK